VTDYQRVRAAGPGRAHKSFNISKLWMCQAEKK